MRLKRNDQSYIEFCRESTNKIVREYQQKYQRISGILDEFPEGLALVHENLKHHLSCSTGGRVTKYTSEHFLRMFIVMFLESLSLRRTIIRVENDMFLRQFVRLGNRPVMDFTVLSRAFSALKPQTWQAILLVMTNYALKKKKITGDKQRVDTTVVETNIHYPTDSSLLWDSYRVLSRTLRDACKKWNLHYRFHDGKVKKLHLFITRNAKSNSAWKKRKVRSTYRKLLKAMYRVAEIAMTIIETFDEPMEPITGELKQYLPLACNVMDQAMRRVFQGEKVPADEKIYSIFEPHTELLKRGKAGKPIEFGHKIFLGQTEQKFIYHYESFECKPEDKDLVDGMFQRHKDVFGHLPKVSAADKGFYESVQKLKDLREKIPMLSICKKGRRTELQEAREKDPEFMDAQRFRAGIEGSISVLKRAFKLLRCMFKGFWNYASAVGCAVFCYNLVVLARL